MNDSFVQKLNDESKLREEMLDDAIKSIANISRQKTMDDKHIQQYKVDEIKYKTSIKELTEYVDIYKDKLKSLEKQNKELNNEVIKLRKKDLKNEKDITAIKSVLTVLIRECGLERISEITKIDKKKLNEYIR